MTLTIAAVALAAITLALLWEEWSWQRRHLDAEKVQPAPVPGRCLCCPGAPHVDDIFTHSALRHRERVPAPEDSREWAS